MARDAAGPLPNDQLIMLATALGHIRDSLLTISLVLTDFVTEIRSLARDEVLTEVDRYLYRIREAKRKF